MNFKEIGWEAVKRLHVPQDRGWEAGSFEDSTA